MEVFTSGHRSFTLEFLFVAKWVNDQWRAWAVSVSWRGEIGDGKIGDGEIDVARSAWRDRRGEIGLARGRGENARQREREM